MSVMDEQDAPIRRRRWWKRFKTPAMNADDPERERGRVKGPSVCERGRRSRRQKERESRQRRRERDGLRETLERREESSPREARSRPGWAGSVRTLKNLWPALRPTSKRCYSWVLGAGTIRFTQRRQKRKKERARERTGEAEGSKRRSTSASVYANEKSDRAR
ncbi:hypothetical protein ALC62_01125 [Cyphomyrmex costatus]|uniref:Uncharacterized protein n=1 Tax=Cyphomyrmex costatus TaxID=456900 RepID=A0A195D4Y2_9HYME|nr:hypothetical protein ALC62_01125 [Cyphomyrmex costatus]